MLEINLVDEDNGYLLDSILQNKFAFSSIEIVGKLTEQERFIFCICKPISIKPFIKYKHLRSIKLNGLYFFEHDSLSTLIKQYPQLNKIKNMKEFLKTRKEFYTDII